MSEETSDGPLSPELRSIGDQLGALIQVLDGPPVDILGQSTGFKKLDERTQGLQGVTVVGGMPGTGKTSLALQISAHAAKKGVPVLFVSLEMPAKDLFLRLSGNAAQVPWRAIGCRRLSDLERNKVLSAWAEFPRWTDKLYVIDEPSRAAFGTLRQHAQAIMGYHSVDRLLIVIDHLQIFPTHGQYGSQKELLDHLVSEFKALATALDSPVLLISQMNRAGYETKGLGSFMGSASIEYLTHMALLLSYPPQPKGKEDEPGSLSVEGDTKPVELTIAKCRSGPAGETLLFDFDGATSTFYEK